jgi:hypothetical protein
MAELKVMGDKGIIDKGIIDGQKVFITLSKGDTIQMNGKTAIVDSFKQGIPNVLIYKIGDNIFAAKPEELAMVQKVGGRRKSRKSRKNKTRRYRRV